MQHKTQKCSCMWTYCWRCVHRCVYRNKHVFPSLATQAWYCTQMTYCTCIEIYREWENLMSAAACAFPHTPRPPYSSGTHRFFRDAYRSGLQICAEAQGMPRHFCTGIPVYTHIFMKNTHMYFSWTPAGLKGLGLANSLGEGRDRTPLVLIVWQGGGGKVGERGHREGGAAGG